MKKLKESALNIISLMWQDMINLKHLLDGYGKDREVAVHARQLRKKGITVIENFIDKNSIGMIKRRLEDLIKDVSAPLRMDNGTYIHIRGHSSETNADHGMIDVFNVDNSIHEVNAIDTSLLTDIIKKASGQKVKPIRKNAYINRNIKQTRIYHVDNVQPVIYKGFLYLTDVTADEYGPYSLVTGSHRFSPYVYWNLFRNLFLKDYRSTDMPHYRTKKVIAAYGDAGALVLSNQNAIHRGLPQGEGKERIALIFNFLVISRASYFSKSFKNHLRRNTM